MKFKPSTYPQELVEYQPKDPFGPIGVPKGTQFAVALWNHRCPQIHPDGIGPLSISYFDYKVNKKHFKTIKFIDENYREISEEDAVLRQIMFHRGMLSKLYKRLESISGE